MAQLGSPDQLPMSLSSIPAEQPVRSVAEGMKPFQPIDTLGEASRAYTLAGQIGQQQDADLDRQDRTTVTDYVKQGGNLSTPEGVQKALQDLGGKLTPKNYTGLMKHGEEAARWNEQLDQFYTTLPEATFKALTAKTEYAAKSLDSSLMAYKAEADKVGGPAARQNFQAAKAANLKYLAGLKTPKGEPLFKPEELKRYEDMSPEQLESELQTTKYHQDVLKGSAEQRFKMAEAQKNTAQAGEAEARTRVLEQGGPAAALYAQMAAQYGEDSPQAKAALTKMQGGGGGGAAARLQGVPEEQISPQERALAVGQWIQNPSSLRGLDKTYQQNVIKWAAGMGITADDVASGQATRKFDIASASASGHRAGGMAAVEATMPGLIAEAQDASSKLPRGKFVPWNKLAQMGEAAMSDPDLKRLMVANQSIASEFQQVISRGGSNVTALNEAMHLLQTAESPQAYQAALNQIQREVQINVRGAEKVREGLAPKHGPTAAAPDADQAAIFNKEYAKIQQDVANAKDPVAKARAEGDLAGLEREANRAGVTLGQPSVGAAPAAPAPVPAAGQPPRVMSLADMKAMVSSGKLKVGDVFIGPDGQPRKLKKLPD